MNPVKSVAKHVNAGTRSWTTTLSGVALALAELQPVFSALGDPNVPMPDNAGNIIFQAVIWIIFGVSARDATVSSEQSAAGVTNKPKFLINCLILGAALFILAGCQAVGPQNVANAKGTTGNAAMDQLSQNNDQWSISTSRIGSHTQVDVDGLNKQTTTPVHDLALLIPLVREGALISTLRSTMQPDGTIIEEQVPVYARAFSSDPTDSQLNGLATGFDENGFYLTLDSVGRQNSTVITAYNVQQLAALEAAGDITTQQRIYGEALLEAGVEWWRVLGELGVAAINPASPLFGQVGAGAGTPEVVPPVPVEPDPTP